MLADPIPHRWKWDTGLWGKPSWCGINLLELYFCFAEVYQDDFLKSVSSSTFAHHPSENLWQYSFVAFLAIYYVTAHFTAAVMHSNTSVHLVVWWLQSWLHYRIIWTSNVQYDDSALKRWFATLTAWEIQKCFLWLQRSWEFSWDE